MQLKTILNRVEPNKSFVYGKITWVQQAACPTIEVEILPRANGRPVCSGCGKSRPGYDRLAPRRFEFVPLWQIAVYFVYALRRVNCPDCGVKVEQVPWSEGKSSLTTTYRWFLAGWAQRLSWQQAASAFHTTWDKVHAAVEYAVWWGLANRELKNVQSIGVDEVDQPQAAIGSADGPACQIEMQIAAAHHRLRQILGKVELVESLVQTLLASRVAAADNWLHSKSLSRSWGVWNEHP